MIKLPIFLYIIDFHLILPDFEEMDYKSDNREVKRKLMLRSSCGIHVLFIQRNPTLDVVIRKRLTPRSWIVNKTIFCLTSQYVVLGVKKTPRLLQTLKIEQATVNSLNIFSISFSMWFAFEINKVNNTLNARYMITY